MRVFGFYDVEEAIDYAAAGGFALHLHSVIVNRQTAPKCFVGEVDAGHPIAHLFHQSEPALVKAARDLGVRVIKVERRGRPGQHVDLCRGPMWKAIKQDPDQDRVKLILDTFKPGGHKPRNKTARGRTFVVASTYASLDAGYHVWSVHQTLGSARYNLGRIERAGGDTPKGYMHLILVLKRNVEAREGHTVFKGAIDWPTTLAILDGSTDGLPADPAPGEAAGLSLGDLARKTLSGGY